jgi:ferritin
MVTKKVEKALNEQILKEEHSSRLYLGMASWCQREGYQGAANFLYKQTDEERMHMLRLVHYLSDRGGTVAYGKMEHLKIEYKTLHDVFDQVLKHEEFISASINDLYAVCIGEKDFTSAQYLQWYINEQIEEESTSRGILDKIRLAGDQKGGLFMIDKELGEMAAMKGATPPAATT